MKPGAKADEQSRPGSAELARARLAQLCAPVSLDEFFSEYYQKKPALFRGSADRAAGLVHHQEIIDAISTEAGPPSGLMVFEEHVVADAKPSPAFAAAHARHVQPGTEALWAYLEAGHPIVYNGARGLSAALDELTAHLSLALSAHVWPNLYATGTAGTPLDIHFDTHEVLALQCEGRKEWLVSKVRVDRPLDHAALRATVQHALTSRREEAESETLMTFEARPGDVVYIPRGQFHNARTPEGRSLHVTFGIEHLTGMDVLDVLAGLALQDVLFRDYLPPPITDEGGERMARQLLEIRARICAIAESRELLVALDEVLAHRIRRSASRWPVG